jgi:hypothetical protein
MDNTNMGGSNPTDPTNTNPAPAMPGTEPVAPAVETPAAPAMPGTEPVAPAMPGAEQTPATPAEDHSGTV